MTTYYKVLNEQGHPIHGGHGRWSLPQDGQPGEWMPPIPDPVPCERGYHLCRDTMDLLNWLGPTIWVAEARGAMVADRNKIAVEQARLVRQLPWDARVARLFAADCAEHVLHLFEATRPGDDRPRRAIAAARAFAAGEATAEELAAAANAAWVAADAAWAAEAAEADAAANAANAAWVAVKAAAATAAAATDAWAAAKAAERRWQADKLGEYLHAGDRSSPRSPPGERAPNKEQRSRPKPPAGNRTNREERSLMSDPTLPEPQPAPTAAGSPGGRVAAIREAFPGFIAGPGGPPTVPSTSDGELIDQSPVKARQLVAGLQALAAMVERHPEAAEIMWCCFDRLLVPAWDRDEVAAMARAGSGSGAVVTKHQNEKYAGVDIAFGSLSLHVYVARERICERVVVGQRTVTREVPDPDQLAAVPLVTVTETVDEVEWRCHARDAALARTTPDYHLDALIKATVDGMAPLTEDQLSKLATLLTSGRRMT